MSFHSYFNRGFRDWEFDESFSSVFNAGGAGLIYGPLAGTVSVADADVIIRDATSTEDTQKYAALGGFDLDNDGTSDLVFDNGEEISLFFGGVGF